DPVERQQEVVLPGRAAVLAVGDRAQPNGLLLADDLLDLAVLDRLQRRRIDLAALALLAGGMERGRAQQTADVVGAERRRGALHNFFFPSPSPRRGEGRGEGLCDFRWSEWPSPGSLRSPPSARRGEGKKDQPHTSFASSTIIRSFAHCSSSARMLPSSVEAKPHCGESAS